ncbi:MAG: NAD(P)-dependent oxidoreductase [Polyangiaceae bacterium]
MADRLDTLPVELLVRGRRAVVIGGDAECAAKVERLLVGGAVVHVFPEGTAPLDAIVARAREGAIAIEERPFEDRDAVGACVVFLSPAHEALGARLAARARVEGTLVCTLDRPEASTFINPAVARGAGLSVSISSGGAAPALVKALRQELERWLGDEALGRFVAELARARRQTPRTARGARAKELLEGFRVDVKAMFPAWFAREVSSRDT